jgi:hypothetical protein
MQACTQDSRSHFLRAVKETRQYDDTHRANFKRAPRMRCAAAVARAHTKLISCVTQLPQLCYLTS